MDILAPKLHRGSPCRHVLLLWAACSLLVRGGFHLAAPLLGRTSRLSGLMSALLRAPATALFQVSLAGWICTGRTDFYYRNAAGPVSRGLALLSPPMTANAEALPTQMNHVRRRCDVQPFPTAS